MIKRLFLLLIIAGFPVAALAQSDNYAVVVKEANGMQIYAAGSGASAVDRDARGSALNACASHATSTTHVILKSPGDYRASKPSATTIPNTTAEAFDGLGSNVSVTINNTKSACATFTGKCHNILVHCSDGDVPTAPADANLSNLQSASTARTNLGLAIGTNVQAFSSALSTLSSNITTFGQSLAASADAATARGLISAFPSAACVMVHNTTMTPYSGPEAARDAAVTVGGGVVMVYQSASVTTSLAKNGVGWWLASGITLTATGSAILFDDGGTNMSYSVFGYGTLDVNSTSHVQTVRVNGSGSVVNISCAQILHTSGDGNHPLDVTIAQNAGILRVTAEYIYGQYAIVEWSDGDMFIRANDMFSPARYGLWTVCAATPTGQMFVYSNRLYAPMPIVFSSSNDSTGRNWFIGELIRSQGGSLAVVPPITIQNCLGYVIAEKFQVDAALNEQFGSGIIQIGGSNGTHTEGHITLQKFAPCNADTGDQSNPAIDVQNAGGVTKAFLDIGYYEDSNASNAMDGLLVEGGAQCFFTTKSWRMSKTGNAVTVDGNSLTECNVLSGSITTQSGSYDLVNGGTSTLNQFPNVVGTGTSGVTTHSGTISYPGSTGTGLLIRASALATVATTGSYTDLSNKPTVPTAANPSATAGASAVNGSASTFLRSDGAPALPIGTSGATLGLLNANKTDSGVDTFSNPLILTAASLGTTAGMIGHDSTQIAFGGYANGIKGFFGRTLFTQTASGTTAGSGTYATITSTGIGTLTLPAAYFVAGKTIVIEASGVYGNGSANAGTVRFKPFIGATSMGVAQVTSPAATGGGDVTNLGWKARIFYTCRTTGSSGTVMAQGMFECLNNTQDPNTSISYADWSAASLNKTAATTINTTGALVLDLQASFSGTPTATDTITCTNLIVYEAN